MVVRFRRWTHTLAYERKDKRCTHDCASTIKGTSNKDDIMDANLTTFHVHGNLLRFGGGVLPRAHGVNRKT